MNFRYFFLIAAILLSSVLSAQTDYFWIGGQGNWTNLNNWVTTSGLAPEEVPDANDNVIFNDNSFAQDNDTVFIFTKNPECKNMIWENLKYNVVLAGGADTTSLSIYGSLTFEEKIFNDYRGKINFQAGTTGNTITTAGNRFFADIYFDGDGEWTLQDTLMTWDTTDWQARLADPTMENPPPDPFIYLQKGTLQTNGQVIIAEGLVSSKENQRLFNMEGSEFFIIGPWVINATGLTLKSANSLITMRGTMSNFNGDGPNLVYNNVIKLPDEAGNAGIIETIDLRSQFNVVEYKGGGVMQASTTPGQLGHFTVDTVTMQWGPAPNAISGFEDSINFGMYGGPGFLNVNESYIKKFILNVGGKLDGKDNDIDSIFYKDLYSFGPAAQGMLVGKNYVDYLYFQTLGVLASYQGSNNTVIDAVYAADGFLSGKNTITNLYLGSGFWYQFSIDSLDNSGNTTGTNLQTILQSITVTGDCEGGLTWLTSTKKTVQANMAVPAAGIATDYLAIRDISNSGGTVTVSNGIDMGNNNGFSITEIANRDLYWVSGQGNWSDKNHWSLTSGGPGGECPPTIRDNIWFEDAGGLGLHDTVFVDVKYGKCHDMIWTVTDTSYISSPVNYDYAPIILPVDTTNLRIWGSLQYTDPMQTVFTGNYFFESQYDTSATGLVVPQTIDFSKKPSYKQMTFYGDNGAWILLDSIINDNDTIFLEMGNLNTNGQKVSCYNFNSMDTLNRVLTLDTTTFVVRQKASDAWFVNGYHFEFNSGKSTIKSMGDEFLMPGEPPNQGHIRSMNADSLVYYNVEFHSLQALLKSEGYCIYNLVDYMDPAPLGQLVGLSVIDTLTFHEGAANCAIKNSDTINVLMAYGLNDTILGGQHIVYEANFFNEGFVFGYNWIGQLNFYKKGTMILQNDVDSAIFYADGYIRGNNTFDTLVFTPGNKYFLQHDGTQTVTTKWDATGTCISPIRIQSDSIGTQAMISAEYPNVEISYTSFRDLYAVDNSGNIPYIASHSNDMGNNTNWNLTEVDDDVYYWIQGSGGWSDSQHWSLSSGGPPIDCLPRELNTVVFDDNSFPAGLGETVAIDVYNASCLSMWWKHTPGQHFPVFTGEDTTNLFIYGSLLLNDSMDYDYQGLIFFDEISGDKKGLGTDTITSKGKTILNDIRFQGINGEWVLADSLTLLVEDPTTYRTIYLEHGKLDTKGHKVSCGSIESEYNNQRGLTISNSVINVTNPYMYGWIVDGDNLTLEADGSTIINNGIFSFVKSYDGDYLEYNDIIMAAPLDSLVNKNNIVEYNVVHIDGPANWFGGNFIADTVIFKGISSGMYLTSQTNVAILDTTNCKISDNHHVNKGIVNFYGTVIGHNDFDYCIFNSDGVFRGENTFDTLILTPGKGNTFWFEEEKSQIIYDSLYLRGNQCQNITIKSLNLSKTAYIKKDEGIIQCDFMNVYNVGTEGANSTFYAGKNSTPLPNPDIPPPGWIFDDSQGYIYGFPDDPVHFCYGDVFEIPSVNFNGDSFTKYYWNDNPDPGDPSFPVTEPGTYWLRAEYTDDCSFSDTIVVESVDPPVVTLDPGPYCEGDIINVEVTPSSDTYSYLWSNGATDENLEAQLVLNGTLSVQATEVEFGCKSADTTVMQVEPVPVPDDILPPDQTLDFGETITLDAGVGDTYSWTADNPLVIIPDPTLRYITVGGVPDPGVTYEVEVSLGICSGQGDVKISEYPRCKCDVPSAFSPNGDGINEVFYVRGSGLHDLEFRIYDRYGKLVFETDNLENGWDGNFNGTKQAKEVYTFYLKGICEDGGIIEKNGNITVIR
jgi:gliding motility-associated-like protein